jgi:hypothetical protein
MAPIDKMRAYQRRNQRQNDRNGQTEQRRLHAASKKPGCPEFRHTEPWCAIRGNTSAPTVEHESCRRTMSGGKHAARITPRHHPTRARSSRPHVAGVMGKSMSGQLKFEKSPA